MTQWEYATTVVEQDWPYDLPEEADSLIYHEHQGHGPDGTLVIGITDLLTSWDTAGWDFVTAIRQNVDVEVDEFELAYHEARYGKAPEGTRLYDTETRDLLIFRRSVALEE